MELSFPLLDIWKWKFPVSLLVGWRSLRDLRLKVVLFFRCLFKAAEYEVWLVLSRQTQTVSFEVATLIFNPSQRLLAVKSTSDVLDPDKPVCNNGNISKVEKQARHFEGISQTKSYQRFRWNRIHSQLFSSTLTEVSSCKRRTLPVISALWLVFISSERSTISD